MPISSTIAYVKARRANDLAALAAGDVASLQGQIDGLASQFSSLSNQVAALSSVDVDALQQQVATLQQQLTDLKNRYESHTHSYADTDDMGVVLDKTTGTPA